MRKISFLLLICALAGSLLAHPASKVMLDFNAETSELTVRFDHKVRDAADHFIYEVTVFLNNKEIIQQKLSSQDTTSEGKLIYRITDARAGDAIKVTTACNKSGKKSQTITVPGAPPASQ